MSEESCHQRPERDGGRGRRSGSVFIDDLSCVMPQAL